MKIYTRTGDQGDTALFAGGRVSKSHLRVEAYGTIDELNAILGVVRAGNPYEQADALLRDVQQQLFHLGADLSTPIDAKADWIVRVTPEEIKWLEEGIDRMTDALEPLRNFILPGGTFAAAQLHVARTVCRRAERLIVALAESDEINPNAIAYVNRLSDWLFTLSRYENQQAGESEQKWALRS